MKAGRELDKLIAEKVMGWEILERFNGSKLAPGWSGAWDGEWCRWFERPDDEDGNKPCLWQPSTRIADAWEVVEKMRKKYNVVLAADNGWGCTFYQIGTDDISRWEVSYGPINADDAPLAICLAALKAVGVDVENEVEI